MTQPKTKKNTILVYLIENVVCAQINMNLKQNKKRKSKSKISAKVSSALNSTTFFVSGDIKLISNTVKLTVGRQMSLNLVPLIFVMQLLNEAANSNFVLVKFISLILLFHTLLTKLKIKPMKCLVNNIKYKKDYLNIRMIWVHA